jgi:hypothetical protein
MANVKRPFSSAKGDLFLIVVWRWIRPNPFYANNYGSEEFPDPASVSGMMAFRTEAPAYAPAKAMARAKTDPAFRWTAMPNTGIQTPAANAQSQARFGRTKPRKAVAKNIAAAVIPVSSQEGRESTQAMRSPRSSAIQSHPQNFSILIIHIQRSLQYLKNTIQSNAAKIMATLDSGLVCCK